MPLIKNFNHSNKPFFLLIVRLVCFLSLSLLSFTTLTPYFFLFLSLLSLSFFSFHSLFISLSLSLLSLCLFFLSLPFFLLSLHLIHFSSERLFSFIASYKTPNTFTSSSLSLSLSLSLSHPSFVKFHCFITFGSFAQFPFHSWSKNNPNKLSNRHKKSLLCHSYPLFPSNHNSQSQEKSYSQIFKEFQFGTYIGLECSVCLKWRFDVCGQGDISTVFTFLLWKFQFEKLQHFHGSGTGIRNSGSSQRGRPGTHLLNFHTYLYIQIVISQLSIKLFCRYS